MIRLCDAPTCMRTASDTNMATVSLRTHPSTEYKEPVLGLLFMPKMMKTAYDNTITPSATETAKTT